MSKPGSGARWAFTWRAGVASFIALSIVLVLAGWVATLFDSQYNDSLVERAVAGVFAGLWGAGLWSPVTALLSLVIAGGAWIYSRRAESTSARGSIES